jgi:DNA-binding CsgD family transcriptional regulator
MGETGRDKLDRLTMRSFGYDPDDPVPRDENGGRRMPDALIDALKRTPVVDVMPGRAVWATRPELSENELAVLRCMSRGMTRKMTADTLNYSFEQIKELLQSARYRLSAKNTTHACCEAIRRGLIP